MLIDKKISNRYRANLEINFDLKMKKSKEEAHDRNS